ncbi:hypothetical protein BFJ68_g17351, partial [Fusarium oxysporum]
MTEHNTDTGGRSFSPTWTHGSDVDDSTHNVDQENRLQPNDIVEKDERRRGPAHGVLPWPRPAAAHQAPPHRPVLPREPQGIGNNGEGGIAGLINDQEEPSRRHTRPAIPGLVRHTRNRRGRSAVRANEGRAPLRDLQPRESTGFPETGEQAYPSPRPTQQSLESEASSETREVREEEKHQKRRRGRPVTRTQAAIPGAVAPRAIRPREATRGQEQASVEQPLRSGSGREDSNLGREHPQHRATDVPPAPFGSKRGKRVRPPTRAREAQEQQTLRQIIPAAQEAPAVAVAVTEPGLGPDISSTLSAPRRKRKTNTAGREGPPAKRARSGARKERTEQEWEEDVASVLRCLDEEFAEKERLSLDKEWCTPVPQERKLSTVQAFYSAFHDTETLPIWTCAVCYWKCGKSELEDVSWDQWESSSVEKRDGSPLTCRKCFPIGGRILACPECVSCLMRDCLSAAARLHVGLGCEHMFPEELKGLTPVEEKLISLNSCYGFITKYNIVDGQRQGAAYPKHVKGHITVFPNNVQELVTRVLPHPLVQVMDEIHVSWHGAQKPYPSDLSRLLSVRRRVVERALAWLRINNPHYGDIEIDVAELDSWGAPPHDVPPQILEHIERNEPSAWEKVRTAQIVPSAERGIDDDDAVDIDDIMAMLRHEQQGGADRPEEASRDDEALFNNGGPEGMGEGRPGAGLKNPEAVVHEVSSSGMFALDAQPDVTDADRLQFAWEAVGEDAENEAGRAAGGRGRAGGWAGSASVRQGLSLEPYISVSRGDDFADSKDPLFFAKTFPTLFPFGTGGPRLVEESIAIAGGEEDTGIDEGAGASARSLVASRNMSLATWAEAVLRRHGGRFATHHIFAFLIFNLGVRSRNRRVSMLSVLRKDFPSVERIVHSLSRERLGLAQQELELSGQTADEGIKELLKSLSLYGFRQPMSREHRLSLRRKIKSLIIRYGIPAIWFTLNPNDITNPVKLRLAAYRSRDPEEAESFLRSLDMAYKRARLAISDPVSSAIFFHREISLFFEHYVKVGEESVFGRISQYFGAVETNERGALHVHGLLWLQGNMRLNSVLTDVCGEEGASYRSSIIEYVDSIFSEDLDQEAFCAVRAERSITSDISPLLQNSPQFAASFDEEANFCAGATQIHTHSPTCVKYSLGRRGGKQDLCRFKAPWKLVEKTAFNPDGVLQIRRSHSMVNRWNKAIAVGLRHNHDISFIATQCKTMALVYYLTNYATKVEDAVWKRMAAASEALDTLDGQQRQDHGADQGDAADGGEGRQNKARQFLMKVANRVFTERPLSQVEVVAHLLGYQTEFSGNVAWTFANVSVLYWRIFRRWSYLRHASGEEVADGEPMNDAVLVEQTGQRVSYFEAYPHRGAVLHGLCLYDYMSLVMLKRRGNGRNSAAAATTTVAWGEIPFQDGAPFSDQWVQRLRRPGKHAVVCLDGFLSMDFSQDDGDGPCHRRAAVQHLALFVPWECFISESSGDINDIWMRKKGKLSRRLLFVLDNVQLLRRSAEDAKRDVRQWAASSANDELAAGETGLGDDGGGVGVSERDDEAKAAYRCDNIGDATRLADIMRSAGGAGQITAGSEELSAMIHQLCRFQYTALGSTAELRAMIASERGARTVTVPLPGGPSIEAEVPSQRLLRSIKSQQVSASREAVKMIQGMQGLSEGNATVNSVLSRFGGHDIQPTAADPEGSSPDAGPTVGICFGSSTSFLVAGRQLAEHSTLNRKQSIAFLLVCRQLDLVHRSEGANSEPIPQLCQFVGGEGGTGKSRVIEALVELFASKGISNRLLVTATSGTAAARINGITIHSACNFSKDASRMAVGRDAVSDGIGSCTPADRYVDGPSRTDWRERDLLIIDEVSMLGARTLWMVNEQLCRLRGSSKDFGGIPIVLFCGDFHQFRPVQERSILLPSTAISWFEQDSFKVEQRRQHDKAHALWRRFTTVVMLDEQVRAAGDPELRGLLTRIRLGIQDQSDVDLLNGRCYQEGRRIPWESGITVVTPLNRNRWNLNMEATLAFQRQHQATLRIFISDHKWKDGQPTEEEALMILNHGDDSAIPVPAVFMFVPGMPVVVNHNTHQGLKLVNGASYTALEVIVDKTFPGYRVSANTILHFGPPAGILLTAETTRDFHFVGMPPGTILLTLMSIKIECQRKRPWQRHDVTRKGLPCTPAFACTDYKVQGRTLRRVALELRGTRTTNIDGKMVPSQCDPYSLYVQLSRCPSLDGIMLVSKA